MEFNYTINLNDPSIEGLVHDEEFYNYNKSRLHLFDKSFESLYHDIINDDSIVFDYIYPKNDFDKKYVKESINIWNSLGITLHNINIRKLYIKNNNSDNLDDGYIMTFKSSNPTKLRLQFKNIVQYDSKLALMEIDNDNFKGVVFEKIILPKVEKKLASTVYAHEMTHTQMVSQDGATKSIFYEEMIPIFMEYVFADIQQNKNENLKYVQNERLMSISKFLLELSKGSRHNYETRVECEKYIISAIQAISLFNIYNNGDNNLKKEILNDINKIFEGIIIVEDIIDKYDVYYDNVPKDIKNLKLKL